MALRKIQTLEHPALRRKAKKVTRFDSYIERLVNDLFETMRAAPGVGLAAPQIGESIRVFVAEYEDQSVALVNPEIIKRNEEMVLGTEGCLSIPGIVGDDVPRYAAVTIKARNPRGKEIRINAEGWFARVLQHELDHLDGVLFIDLIPKEKVHPVEEDEVAQEAEVATTAPARKGARSNGQSGQNGKRGESNAALAPEHNERPAPASADAKERQPRRGPASPSESQPARTNPAGKQTPGGAS
jgi:peptide deformylase